MMKKMTAREKMNSQHSAEEASQDGLARLAWDQVKVMKSSLNEMLASLVEEVLLILTLPSKSLNVQRHLQPVRLMHQREGEGLRRKNRNLKTN